MAGRRSVIAIVLLAAALHAMGITRAILPAQDGLKYLRIARQFQALPWTDVIRASDQHPLYPALVALTEPLIASIAGRGPDAWRIAAQAVSALAALALLVPLHGLTRVLFNDRIATLAVLIYVLLPLPAEVGHDTLSDSLALLASVLSLRLGEAALRSRGWSAAVGCGLAAGFGFLARPEVLVVPAAVLVASAATWRQPFFSSHAVPRLSALAVSFLAIVGSYALIKGEVSEKLALRQSATIGPRPAEVKVRKAPHWLPPGLDDPRWDFSPKEDSEDVGHATLGAALKRLVLDWSEGLAWVFSIFAVWGLVRDRFIRRVIAEDESRPSGNARRLLAIYLALFSAVLVRHALRMGYLSGRHTLMLVVVSVPWAAAGTFVCARGLAIKLNLSPRLARAFGAALLLVAIGAGVFLQCKPSHPTRWGHWAAGRWLVDHARAADTVLDTRGWAAFVSGQPSYDYWHVRQAFTDSRLAYIVVGTDELSCRSRRAATLRAILAYAATPVASFPEIEGGHDAGVLVYHYRRPESWEGLRP